MNKYTEEQVRKSADSVKNSDCHGISAMLNAYADLLAAQRAQAEPVAWISEVQCIGPEYKKQHFGSLPIQSLQPGYYKHYPLYTHPPAQPVADDMAARVRSCLVCWRCASCRHDLIEMPEDPFGACPACGVKSAMHHVFSIDTEGLAAIANSGPVAQPVAVPDGYKLVPSEVTDEMHTAFCADHGSFDDAYKAMISAAEGAKLPPGFHGCKWYKDSPPPGVVVTSEPAEGAKVAEPVAMRWKTQRSVSWNYDDLAPGEKGDDLGDHIVAAELLYAVPIAQQAEVLSDELESYDAGLFGDYGGGNVEWWHDYMRAELARAHDFYADQFSRAIERAACAPLLAQIDDMCSRLEQLDKQAGETVAMALDLDEKATSAVENFNRMHERIAELESALAESRANDQTAMGYLTEIRAIVGGDDFPDMVKRVAALAQPSGGDERAAFEREMRCEDEWGHKSLKKDKHGHYLNSWTAVMWKVWQARAALTQQQGQDTELWQAIRDMLSQRIGELPAQGWLRDNDTTRQAVARIAAIEEQKGQRS